MEHTTEIGPVCIEGFVKSHSKETYLTLFKPELLSFFDGAIFGDWYVMYFTSGNAGVESRGENGWWWHSCGDPGEK